MTGKNSISAKDRLIVALDVDTIEEAEKLVEQLADYVGVFKVGMQLFNSNGPEIIERLHAKGGKIFLDLKFHDIPNTVAHAGQAVTRHGVYMYNVHAAGGFQMMKTTVDKTIDVCNKEGLNKPVIIAVTILTSMDQETMNNEVGIKGTVMDTVVRWAKLTKEAGMDGVVASPLEIKAIREACGEDFFIVTPGVRPTWAAANDQKRVMTPKEAIAAGATYLVVGRPITAAENPVEAAKLVLQEIEEGLK